MSYLARRNLATIHLHSIPCKRERHTTVQILETLPEGATMPLPEGATMRDFIDACEQRLAQDMGITPEQLEALRPLLKALAAHQ